LRNAHAADIRVHNRRDRLASIMPVSESNVSVKLPAGRIDGYCHPDWEGVLAAFVDNFHERHELGASLCVRFKNKAVIDVWGGLTNESGSAWKRNDISVVFSATKGATALCAHLLASRGELDLNAPVGRYWPEYKKNGKASTTVAMLLNHSAGVPGFREPLPKGAFADWPYMIERLEDEAPWWEPGLYSGYHLMNFGWTVGELVRRVSGISLGEFFQREIAQPGNIDFWIGLPEAREPDVVDMQPFVPKQFWDFPAAPLPRLRQSEPTHPAVIVSGHLGGYFDMDPITGEYNPNSRLCHAAEIGALGGITNARGLASMYQPLAYSGGLLSEDHIWRMSQVSAVSEKDPILQITTRFSLGYMKSMDNRYLWGRDYQSLLLGDRAFGHVGAGGSLGFADPDHNLSFGYTMNRMGPGSLLNPRGQALVDAVYQKLGCRSNASGVWANRVSHTRVRS
jgi:CubicO group peptidase (beta-lactamase class C family)